jgi:hypothetical protein
LKTELHLDSLQGRRQHLLSRLSEGLSTIKLTGEFFFYPEN